MAKTTDTTLIMCRDLCQEIATHVTPIPTFYNIAIFLHVKDKLKLNVRQSAWITPKPTSIVEDQWKEMIEDERNMFCLGWAMNWEELENDMHLTYLAGSILARIILAYFQIVRFEKTLGALETDRRKGFHSVTPTELGKNLLVSGVAVSVATGFTHPLDVVKVRLQMELIGERAASTGMVRKLAVMVEKEGFQSLYYGLQPALLRSALYGCMRLGLYEPCKLAIDSAVDHSNVLTKLAAGAVSGSFATAATNPLEVLKVRLQAQNYTSDSGISREIQKVLQIEGIQGLWKGVGPAMARAATLTASQVATYDESKQIIKHIGRLDEGVLLHLSASTVAGFLGTIATSPIDTIKTRLMMQRESSGNLYDNAFDCGYKILRTEGLRGLYKGWVVLLARLGPQTTITFMLYEKMRQFVGMDAL